MNLDAHACASRWSTCFVAGTLIASLLSGFAATVSAWFAYQSNSAALRTLHTAEQLKAAESAVAFVQRAAAFRSGSERLLDYQMASYARWIEAFEKYPDARVSYVKDIMAHEKVFWSQKNEYDVQYADMRNSYSSAVWHFTILDLNDSFDRFVDILKKSQAVFGGGEDSAWTLARSFERVLRSGSKNDLAEMRDHLRRAHERMTGLREINREIADAARGITEEIAARLRGGGLPIAQVKRVGPHS